ncbi:MAG: PLP-dependent aminotransferase family protein [Pseudomonadota bacterium]|nr:PLP-dependent aminotransferase family protein [Pseudomonadota bacterium]
MTPFARRMDGMKASEIRELLKLVDQPEVISFAGGIPDPVLFPAAAARAAYAAALRDPAAALQYGVSEGYAPLREWIAAGMRRDGVPASADNILVTAGSQQGLDFLGKALISPGDTILCEYPTYLGALQAFSAYEPRYERLRLDGGNQTPAAYSKRAKNSGAVKALYLVPDFANPTGLSLTPAERAAALDLARELDALVIEDAAYRALRFAGEARLSLQALDVAAGGDLERSRVIYLGTFSKTVAPGMRVGWVCAPRAVIAKLTLIHQASALHVSSINQIAMLAIVEAGLDPLIAAARAHYRAKRDALLDALERHAPGLARTAPQGGLFSWVTLPQGADAAALLRRALAEVKVAFVPGAAFHPDGSGANTLRLSYSLPTNERIEEGIWRLAKLL